MKWARYKLILVSGIIALVVCGVLVFWMLSSSATLGELETSVSRLRQQQNSLVSSDLYPSEANLVELRAEQQNVKQRRDELKEIIREGQVKAPVINRSVFGDYINDVVPDLQQAASSATRGGEEGVVLRDPDFGLTEFLEGTLPTQRRINTLVVEIETIQHVAKLLFESGISELITISVKSEETAENDLRVSTRERRAVRNLRADSNSPKEENNDESRVEKERERLFSEIVLHIEFKAYEDFFWEALNQILADSNQLVISSMSVTNANTLLWPDYLQTPYRKTETRAARKERREPVRRSAPETDLLSLLEGSSDGAAPQVVEEEKLPGLADRQLNVVGGDLLNVVLELKVFRLKPAEETATQPEGI